MSLTREQKRCVRVLLSIHLADTVSNTESPSILAEDIGADESDVAEYMGQIVRRIDREVLGFDPQDPA